jgi:hypothetical protein
MNTDINGTWYNQHGSALELTVDAEGRVKGAFSPGVGHVPSDVTYEVTGYVSGDVVAFMARFTPQRSVTSWVGHLTGRGGAARLETLWHMAVDFPPSHKPEERWRGTWSGADVYRREKHIDDAQRRPSHPTG